MEIKKTTAQNISFTEAYQELKSNENAAETTDWKTTDSVENADGLTASDTNMFQAGGSYLAVTTEETPQTGEVISRRQLFTQAFAAEMRAQLLSIGVDLDENILNSVATAIINGGVQGMFTALGVAYSIAKAASTQPPDGSGIAVLFDALASVPPRPVEDNNNFFLFSFQPPGSNPGDELAAAIVNPLLNNPEFIPIDLTDKIEILKQLMDLPFGHSSKAAFTASYQEVSKSFLERISGAPSRELEVGMNKLNQLFPILLDAIGWNLA